VVGPTDAVTDVAGRWELKGDELVFYHGSADQPGRVLKIDSVDRERLVVKK